MCKLSWCLLTTAAVHALVTALNSTAIKQASRRRGQHAALASRTHECIALLDEISLGRALAANTLGKRTTLGNAACTGCNPLCARRIRRNLDRRASRGRGAATAQNDTAALADLGTAALLESSRARVVRLLGRALRLGSLALASRLGRAAATRLPATNLATRALFCTGLNHGLKRSTDNLKRFHLFRRMTKTFLWIQELLESQCWSMTGWPNDGNSQVFLGLGSPKDNLHLPFLQGSFRYMR